jgi:hypothetical protein
MPAEREKNMLGTLDADADEEPPNGECTANIDRQMPGKYLLDAAQASVVHPKGQSRSPRRI